VALTRKRPKPKPKHKRKAKTPAPVPTSMPVTASGVTAASSPGGIAGGAPSTTAGVSSSAAGLTMGDLGDAVYSSGTADAPQYHYHLQRTYTQALAEQSVPGGEA
jgi:hypothetical protein